MSVAQKTGDRSSGDINADVAETPSNQLNKSIFEAERPKAAPTDGPQTKRKVILPWTDEEVELMRRLFEDEKKAAVEIAAILNRTPGSVAVKLNRLGLTVRAKPQKVNPKINPVLEPWEEEMERERLAKIKKRNCLSCGVVFTSEGPHNRRCGACRGISSPYGLLV